MLVRADASRFAKIAQLPIAKLSKQSSRALGHRGSGSAKKKIVRHPLLVHDVHVVDPLQDIVPVVGQLSTVFPERVL